MAGRFARTSCFGQRTFSGPWHNRLYLGDNRDVLTALRDDPDVRGQVRLVYIDPPFATGQEFRIGKERTGHVSSGLGDAVAYTDDLRGAEYLAFLKERLLLVRELLADDGSVYVHIDCKIGHRVRMLLDDRFGEDRFVNEIARVKCNPKNFDRRAYGNIKDVILFYTKTARYVWNEATEEYSADDIARLFPKVEAGSGRRYTTTPLHAPGETHSGPTGQPWRSIRPPKGRHWRYSPETLDDLDQQGLVEWSSTGNPRKKVFANEAERKRKKRQDVWEFKDPPYPEYPTEKNLDMLKVIVETSSNPGDLVMDCFAGSGTTLLAAELLGRRWIGVDSSALAVQVAVRRLSAIDAAHEFCLHSEQAWGDLCPDLQRPRAAGVWGDRR
jgi:adenine-specific DNA-methyltransferase